jgi:hypothetical protein
MIRFIALAVATSIAIDGLLDALVSDAQLPNIFSLLLLPHRLAIVFAAHPQLRSSMPLCM